MIACLLLTLTLPPQDTAAISKRAVDYVSVTGRAPLFGIVLEHNPRSHTLVAVQRDYLRQNSPKDYSIYRKQEVAREKANHETLLKRLRAWRTERANDADLMEFLDEQLAKLQKVKLEAAAESDKQFILIQLERKRVRTVRQQLKRRTTLWVAYRERLANIETRSAEALVEELRKKEVAVPKKPVNLSDRVPPRGDDKFQWAARQAIIEQLYRKPVKMQGTPTMLLRTGNGGQPINAEAIMAKMMEERMSSLINQLTEPNAQPQKSKSKWFQQAVAEAKKTDSRAAYVTLVIPDPTMQQVVVEAYLIGRMPDRTWRVVWKNQQKLKPEERADVEADLMENEQIAGVLNALKGLGKEDAVRKAVRFGAGTQEALRKVEAAYVEWRDPYYDDLRGPAIAMPRK